MINEVTKNYIRDNAEVDVKILALRSSKNSDIDIKFALEQIAAYQTARKKIPSWSACKDVIYPVHLSMEQCSSEMTARYKAEIIRKESNGRDFVDLTGGFGVDSYSISRKFDEAEYVEMNGRLCEVAEHNFRVLEASNITVRNTTAEEYLEGTRGEGKVVYIDPHRRDDRGGKVVSIKDCAPDVCELRDKIFAIGDDLFVKLSPMLDITLAISEIGNVKSVWVVSLRNECKEVLIHSHKGHEGDTRICCVNIKGDGEIDEFSCMMEDEKMIEGGVVDRGGDIGKYIYEPNASIMKAGLFKITGKHWGVEKLHKHSHLYTSDDLVDGFHGRIFEVIRCVDFTKRAAKEIGLDGGKANVLTRNFPLSANALRDKLKLKDGGEFYVIGTILANGQKVLVVAKRIISVR